MENLTKINTNSKPPLSQRAMNTNQKRQQAQMTSDELLPLMLLNPPIALFDEEDRQRFVNGHQVGQ